MNLPILKWSPSPNFYPAGDPRVETLDLLVLHDCESSYQSAINTFLSKTGGAAGPVSAHLVLKEDGSEVTQMVSFDDRAWHCRSFNGRSVGLEMAGYADRGYPESELQNAAEVMACLCHLFGIPPQWAHGGTGPGITTHFDLGKAGGGHSDPSTDPHLFTAFLARVTTAYQAGGFPATWGHGSPSSTPASPTIPTLDTKTLQHTLNLWGSKPPLDEDGQFGPKTKDALARFQAAHYLFANGVIDARTIAALERVK